LGNKKQKKKNPTKRVVGEKFEKRLLVRLTKLEWAELEKRADQAGRSLSRYLITAGIGVENVVSEEELYRQERALYHVRKIGVILERMVKKFSNGVDKDKLNQILEEQGKALRELRECRKALVKSNAARPLSMNSAESAETGE
jgi:hypothetical protein